MGSRKKIPEHLRNEPSGRAADTIGRRWAKAALREADEELEARVAQRTAELEEANASLRREIEEGRRAGEALRESEERLRHIYEDSPIGIELYDSDGRLVDLNQACQDMFGVADVAEVRGFKLFEDPNVSQQAKESLLKGETVRYEAPFDFEKVRELKLYNTTRSGVVYFDVLITPVAWRRHEPFSGYLVQVQGINERKQAEEALRESEERLRTLVTHAPVILFAIDRKGVFTLAEGRGLSALGLSPGEHVGLSVFDVYGDTPDVVDAARRALAGEAFTAMVEVEDLVFEAHVTPVRDGDGTVTGGIAVATDITERKRAEEELERHRDHLAELVEERAAEVTALNRELESFVHSVSHELRAPLRSIDGFSRAVLDDLGDRLDGPARDWLGRVRGATQRMGQLIDGLLTLSCVTATEIRRETVDLSALAQTVAAELQEREPKRRVTFEIEERLTASGDTSLLRLVLENLLGNAWKFTRDTASPRIAFGLVQGGGEPTYFVRDNGAGFDMAGSDRLFGPFQRLHSESEFPGSGVGLATVQRIVHRHGGRVRAEGSVGQGATFYFTLRGQAGQGRRRRQPSDQR